MKLNNKGFAISSIMYIILVLAVILISLILVTLSSRKLILDKLKDEVLTTIYEAPNITYRQTIKELKSEAIVYMENNSLEKESIKIENLDSSIDEEVLEKYKLNDKYLTAVQNTDSYNVYLGKASTISNTTELPKNTIDIVDYKIYGNSYQETSVQGKNLFSISNRTLGTLSSGTSNTNVREFEFDKYYVGLTINNYYLPSNVTSYSISGENVTIKSNFGGYGIGIPIKVKSNTTYSFSAITEERIGVGFYTSSGEYIDDTNSATFTTPENCEIITVVLRPKINVDATYTNVQLEEGAKATQYEEFVPNMPSIEYPSEILSVGEYDETPGKYKIPVKTSGKNLFNSSILLEQGFELQQDGSYWAEYSSAPYKKIPFSNENNYKGQLTISYDIKYVLHNDILGAVLYVMYTDGTREGTIDMNQNNPTEYQNVVFNTNPNKVVDYLWWSYGTGYAQTYLKNIQLEYGNTVTDYEPYVEPITTNIYLDEPLRKIDIYDDHIDFENKKVVRNIVQYTTTGSESFTIGAKNTDTIRFYSNGYQATGYGTNGNNGQELILSNKLTTSKKSNIESTMCTGNISSEVSGLFNIEILKTRFGYENSDTDETILEKFKTWIINNPITMNWVINPYARPREIPTQLPKINTNFGATQITIDTELMPSNYEFTVVEKIIEI